MEVKLIPTYQFVKSKCSMKGSPADMAFGKALDTALSQHNYYQSLTFRPLLREAMRCTMKVFAEELRKQGVELSRSEKVAYAGRAWRMLSCWRKSKYAELLRPRTHVILLEKNGALYGVFAQPDFWDEVSVFYEVKSYDVEEDEDAAKCVKEQCRVFSLLGELRLVYFTKDANGYYALVEKQVEKDPGVLDDLWEYISSLEEDQSTQAELDDLLGYYPVVKYSFNAEENRWDFLGYVEPDEEEIQEEFYEDDWE